MTDLIDPVGRRTPTVARTAVPITVAHGDGIGP